MNKPLVLSSVFLFAAGLARAEASRSSGPGVSIKDVPAEGDSTITIRKGTPGKSVEPDFQIESGTEEISGDPVAGLKESFESWKKACVEWKKDMREMNGAALLSLNCGTPKPERDKSSRVTQSSVGTYKLKVRIRDER